MKKIKLTQGKYTLVDNEDFEWLNKWKWCAHKTRGDLWTAERSNKKGKLLKMHRVILKARKGQEVDHLNRNSLDNRRKNIRICTRSENLLNRGMFKNRRGYKGVYKKGYVGIHKTCYYWVAEIHRNCKKYYLGSYSTQLEAKLARDKALKKL